MEHTERSAPGAEAKALTLRARWWDNDDPPTVLIKPRHSYTEGYDAGQEVYLPDGTWIGTVVKYTGSLDRKIGRLRSPGKRRTLWSWQTPGPGRAMFGEVSRADCIRHLIASHERRTRR